MPLVEVTEVIAAPVDRVWEVVNDVASYPRLIAHVRSLTTLESTATHRLIKWEVEVKGCLMSWVERQEIDAMHHRIDYRMVEGDLASLTGFWQLESLTAESSRATVSVMFDIGIPMLCDMLNPLCERAIRDNWTRMLRSVGNEAAQEPQATEVQ